MTKQNKIPPWDIKQLMCVLNALKKGKSRDPHGFPNELFRPEVAGNNLIQGLLLLLNEVKEQQKIPQMFQHANITSFFKGKGDKMDMDNQRGIFGTTIFRYILDRLIYNDVYDVVDKNINDSNVGARKGRNIRDNLFVLYATMNSASQGELDNMDIQLFDVVKCFDKLWLE